jgi:hypothetical protein
MRLLLSLLALLPISCATLPRDAASVVAEHTIIVDAPVEELWAYASDSTQAVRWSIYFHHITPMDGPDGELGSTRRCFRQVDEAGVRWDEEVIDLVRLRRRRMRVYNLRGFSWPGTELQEMVVDQVFEDLGGGRSSLTFRTWLRGPDDVNARASWRLTRGEVERIFARNLENIGRAVEQKDRYSRRWAYEVPRGAK